MFRIFCRWKCMNVETWSNVCRHSTLCTNVFIIIIIFKLVRNCRWAPNGHTISQFTIFTRRHAKLIDIDTWMERKTYIVCKIVVAWSGDTNICTIFDEIVLNWYVRRGLAFSGIHTRLHLFTVSTSTHNSPSHRATHTTCVWMCNLQLTSKRTWESESSRLVFNVQVHICHFSCRPETSMCGIRQHFNVSICACMSYVCSGIAQLPFSLHVFGIHSFSNYLYLFVRPNGSGSLPPLYTALISN